MTDHGLVPDDETTQPARQGEVPDWFASSEASTPVVNDAPDTDAQVTATPIDTRPLSPAPAKDPEHGEHDEHDDDEDNGDFEELDASEDADEDAYDDADAEDADSADHAEPLRPPSPPVGTRRRRPARQAAAAAPVPPAGRGYACADVITAIFLLLTILVVSGTILLVANPRSPMNPFQPPTYPGILVLASAVPTDTPTQTFTPEPNTPTPIPSPTPTRTLTPTPTLTRTPVVGGGVQPTRTSQTSLTQPSRTAPTQPPYTLSPFPFTVKPLKYTANTTQDACQWQSIAGSVVDMAGKPIKGLAIRVTGSNGNIDEVHYSGTETRFGEGGFEVFLGATPREDQYTIQLLGRTGAPISDTITIQTKAGCDQNVVLVAFTQNHPY